MVVMAALLRGVNVGGHATLSMADLRAIAAANGCEQARTYIQSGNLVFGTAELRTDVVAGRLREALAAAMDVAPDIVVRTRDELGSVVEASPFLQRGEDRAHLHVLFTSGPGAAVVELVDPTAYLPEEVAAVGRDLHLYLLSGVGRSRLAADVVRRHGATGTMRNWRTVTKMLDMANALS